jgi:hypothetical protein
VPPVKIGESLCRFGDQKPNAEPEQGLRSQRPGHKIS